MKKLMLFVALLFPTFMLSGCGNKAQDFINDSLSATLEVKQADIKDDTSLLINKPKAIALVSVTNNSEYYFNGLRVEAISDDASLGYIEIYLKPQENNTYYLPLNQEVDSSKVELQPQFSSDKPKQSEIKETFEETVSKEEDPSIIYPSDVEITSDGENAEYYATDIDGNEYPLYTFTVKNNSDRELTLTDANSIFIGEKDGKVTGINEPGLAQMFVGDSKAEEVTIPANSQVTIDTVIIGNGDYSNTKLYFRGAIRV